MNPQGLDPTQCRQGNQATGETGVVVGQVRREEVGRSPVEVACCQAWEEGFVGQMSLPH